jgi:Ca2+-binding EF-hand superfamily protein
MNQTIRKYTIKEMDFSYIKREICNMYGMDVKIIYIDRQNDQFIIETQANFMHVIIDSTTQAYNELVISHINRMGINYEPTVIPEVHIKLIVSPTNNYGILNNLIETNDIYTNFPNYKEIICRELNYTYAIPLNEIEFIYNEFNRVSVGRTANGLLNKTEFCLFMADKIKDQSIVECFFNAIDEKKTGFISIKRFVEALKVIRSNCTDDKIRLIFNAYSSTYGFMTQDDFSNMMLSNGMTVNILEANYLSEKVISSFNLRKDGKLVFAEFKNVYNMNTVRLSATWDEIFYLKFAEVVVQCFKCAKKVYQRELRGQPPVCLDCCKLVRSPISYLFN